jgi:hypothetical protein
VIVSKRRDTSENGGFELHFLAENLKADWKLTHKL